MCGIAGIIQRDAVGPPVDGRVEAMRKALLHRGPDDAGSFVSAGRHALFAHTRLSILDLSSAGHQPMTDGGLTITFNGEIYNFRELRADLESKGEIFRTNTDTEVILKLYKLHGPACVRQLRGMFAFALWDEAKQTGFLARDPLGIKPLYYHFGGGRLAFASELRALLASDLMPRRLNPNGLQGYFCSGTVPEPDTIVQDVHCLEAGHWLLWREGKLDKYSYWDWQMPRQDRSIDAVRCTREALLDSVRHHFVSDVPVGVFLSGGIDSTAIVALSRAVGQQDLRTFCISFAEPEFDEGSEASATAKLFGTQHSEWRLDAGMGRDLFQEFLKRLDQPSIDGFNSFCVSKFAHDQGMKVVLSGLGGDEVFGGYPSFQQVPRLVQASRQFEAVAPLRRAAGTALEAFSPGPRWQRLGAYLRSEATTQKAYEAFRGVFVARDASNLTLRFCQTLPNGVRTIPAIKADSQEDEVCALEFHRYLRNQLLRDSDAMSMAWSLELRVPFVDQKLLETLLQIPAGIRLAKGKRLLLEAVPEIPVKIAQAPKRGFRFPFEQWMRSEWDELFKNSANGHGVLARTWYQKWSLFVLERWCQNLGVN